MKRGIARNKDSRVWRFVLATDELLRRRALRGEHMAVWLGHAVSLLGLARPAYAIFDAVYHFNNVAWGRRLPMDARVREELRAARGLAWVAEVDLSAPFLERIYATDASDSGYGVIYQPVRALEIRATWNWRERWRYNRVRDPLTACALSPAGTAACGGLPDLYCPIVRNTLAEDGLGARLRVRGGARSGLGIDAEYGKYPQRGVGLSETTQQNTCRRPRRRPHVQEVEVQNGLEPPACLDYWLCGDKFKIVASRRRRLAHEHI